MLFQTYTSLNQYSKLSNHPSSITNSPNLTLIQKNSILIEYKYM